MDMTGLQQSPRARRARGARLYSPGGCGCALLMAPVMALGATLSLAAIGAGLAGALIGIVALCLGVHLVRSRAVQNPRRPWLIALDVALWLIALPLLAFFIWFMS